MRRTMGGDDNMKNTKDIVTKPNIVFITVDCFRKDALEHMPFLVSLISKAIYFENAYSPSTCTYFSFPSIFTGKEPLLTENFNLKSEENFVFYLKKNGYLTFGINAGNPWLSKFYDYNANFDFFEDFFDLDYFKNVNSRKIAKNNLISMKKKLSKLLPQRTKIYLTAFSTYIKYKRAKINNWSIYNAEKVTNEIEKLLNNNSINNKSKFFWLHFMDLHEPYYSKLPPSFQEILLNIKLHHLRNKETNIKLINKIKEIYFKKANTLDRELKKIFLIFSKHNITPKNTIFIVTGDHGQEFLEEEGIYHYTYRSFHKSLTNVPFIIYGKGISVKKEKSTFSLNLMYEIISDISQKGILVNRIKKDDIALVVRPAIKSLDSKILLKSFPDNFYKELWGAIYFEDINIARFVIRNFKLKELNYLVDIGNLLKEKVEKKIDNYIKKLRFFKNKKLIKFKISKLKKKIEKESNKL